VAALCKRWRKVEERWNRMLLPPRTSDPTGWAQQTSPATSVEQIAMILFPYELLSFEDKSIG